MIAKLSRLWKNFLRKGGLVAIRGRADGSAGKPKGHLIFRREKSPADCEENAGEGHPLIMEGPGKKRKQSQ